YIEREADEIVRIESVDLIRSLFPAQQNLVSSVSATFIAEMVDTFAPANDPAELIYRLLDRTTEALLAGAASLPIVTYAEIWPLRPAGIFPSLRNCITCSNALTRPLRFDAQREGFVCDACGGRESFIVPNDVADAIETIGRTPVADFASQSWAVETLME